jgi:Mrr N-terminal domain
MSPQVDLDDDVFEYLKSCAEPFVDTPSTVLRRLLGLGGSSPEPGTAVVPGALEKVDRSAAAKRKKQKKLVSVRKRTRAAAGTLLPEEEYVQPLLRVLDEAGGQAPFRDVADAVGRMMEDKLMEADFETLNSGGVRWQNRLQFVRLRLVQRGLLERDSPRGIWEISDSGREALRESGSERI